MAADDKAPRHYFIYYRVRDDVDVDDAHATVRSMQVELEKACGVAGRLFIRAHEDATWMEVYEGVTEPERFEHALREGVVQHALEDIVQPGAARHMECFVECV
ncbi:DUF4936 family protein [Azoarcus sp. L1K30]|uniref:DUF4936 family protein n=1 Tax=Azoarcus sp. L1K30 TaxID=2820277 RepID=UPI001B81D624|nr:DUF4936 family protein [Azoarcus sp. L1K30]MBR0565762.1 DUF4936 family protein [Azoarcus sp. L1K30]